MEKFKRYLIFLVGLFISSLGVSLVTKANLGTSPISSIPYVLSLNFSLTLGNFTIIFSLFLIALQLLILRNDFKLDTYYRFRFQSCSDTLSTGQCFSYLSFTRIPICSRSLHF